MQEVQLFKTEHFGAVQTDIYIDDKDMFMTANQLGECLGYSNGRKGIDNLLSRSDYLKQEEFSVTLELRGTDGKQYDTRAFTEDGIYEVTMLSRTEKAKEFRSWVRKILKSIRTGQATIVSTDKLKQIEMQAKQDRAKAMLLNAQNRALKTIMSTVDNKGLSAVALEVFGLKAIEQVTGLDMSQHLPEVGKLYSATDIGKMFGVTSQRIGIIANANNLKTDEYGIFAMDKSRYSSKEVASFRYNDKAIHRFRGLLGINKR